ncbi:MAG: efflux RND transporter periplasmic adaptor subunit [Rhodospirillaceae bacterium]|nr:efflux RND transporter periplasmic adaptor subunit [Rhodospirillaceae bacterium]
MNYQDVPSQTAMSPTQVAPVRTAVDPARVRRAVLWAGVIALVVVGLLVGFDLFRKQMMASFFASNTPPPVSVNYETLSPSAVARSLSAVGSISAIHHVTISSEAAGTVKSITFLPGQPVKAGDLIVQLNDATERADLANARAQQKLAIANLKRAQELASKGNLSQAQLDQAQSQSEIATAAISRIEALIDQKAVRAPFDGTLGIRETEVGHYLDRGKAIVHITNMKELFVEFSLPEQARPQLSLTQTLDLTVDAYPGRVFKAEIAVIDPQISVATRSIKLQAVADNFDGLLMPGMFANVHVALPVDQGQMTIPETALDYSLYGNSVYVIEDAGTAADGKPIMKAKRTTVKTGSSVDGRIVVTEGLSQGQRIVTTGLSKLFDGATLILNATPTLVKPATVPVP